MRRFGQVPLAARFLAAGLLATALLATSCATPDASSERPAEPSLTDQAPAVARPPPRPGTAPLPPFVAARASTPVTAPLPTPPDAPAGPSATPAVGAVSAVVYRVGERAISTADLGDFVLRFFPDRATDALTQLVDEALIDQEAAREQVTLPADAIARRTDLYLAERTREIRVQYGASASLERIVRKKYGRSLEAYRSDAARLARLTLLRDRLVRLDQLRQGGVEVRVLVVPDLRAAEDAVRRLRAGADMTRLAERLQVQPPAAPPPFTRAEIEPPELAERLIGSRDGSVLEPLAFDGELEGEPHVWWQVFKVVRAWQPTDAPWEDVAEEIEERLRVGGAVSVQEYARWRARAGERLGIAAGPRDD